MNFRQQTLSNGLQVIAEVNDAALSLAVGFFVQAGSRDETDELAGVSHFLEHMVFKGTPTRSAEDVNREFDEMGAHYNAFTSEEQTVYYASLLPEHQGDAVALLGDILRPSLREEDFTMEKKVILEEIEMYLDQPPYGMDDRLKSLCFGSHPIARSVLGTAESVAALSPEAMRGYFASRYAPGNVVLAASGRVDFDQLVAQAERACGAWERKATLRDDPPVAIRAAHEFHAHEGAQQQYALLLSGAPDGRSQDRYAAKLLATAVGDDSGSRLYWRLVDPGRAESASLGHYDYQGVGMFYTWLSGDPGSGEANLQTVLDELAALSSNPITQEELTQAKSKVKSRVVLSGERPRNRLFSLGGNWLMRGEYLGLVDDLEALDRVTTDDIVRVAAEYQIEGPAIVTVGPQSVSV